MMDTMDNFFVLKQIQPFDRLHDLELYILASATDRVEYTPNLLIAAKDNFLHHLYVVLEGELIRSDKHSLPSIVGLGSLLYDWPLKYDLLASASGAVCLKIGKSHFITLIYECPHFTTALLQHAGEETYYNQE